MCTMSMVGDHYQDIFRQKPWLQPSLPVWPPNADQTVVVEHIGRAEFDELKRQVEEMKALLIRAKEYDERNGEPDCEIAEKMDVLRKVAKLVGVDLDEVLKPRAD